MASYKISVNGQAICTIYRESHIYHDETVKDATYLEIIDDATGISLATFYCVTKKEIEHDHGSFYHLRLTMLERTED